MGRSVFVTGGNRGIGLAIAKSFAAQGDNVAVGVRSGTAPDGLFAVRCDVTVDEDVEEAFAKVEAHQGPVEVLVANAGITRDTPMLLMSDEDFRDVLETNLVGAFRVARKAARGMLAARWGRVVFLSSAIGFAGAPGQTNYTATKTALLGLARSLVWEVGTRGITVNVVAPGLIDTDMTRDISSRRLEDLMTMTPMKRAGTAEEVADVVRFLAGDTAGYVTGAVVPVAGGLGMGN
jgi:3-oxoacyl-[acyl-carrier protein] reductase